MGIALELESLEPRDDKARRTLWFILWAGRKFVCWTALESRECHEGRSKDISANSIPGTGTSFVPSKPCGYCHWSSPDHVDTRRILFQILPSDYRLWIVSFKVLTTDSRDVSPAWYWTATRQPVQLRSLRARNGMHVLDNMLPILIKIQVGESQGGLKLENTPYAITPWSQEWSQCAPCTEQASRVLYRP